MWLIAGVLGSVLTVQAASVTLEWDASQPSNEVDGYLLHYAPAAAPGPLDAPGPNKHHVDVGKVTRHTVEDLNEGIAYVFAVQAYEKGGRRRKSDLSNEVHYRVPIRLTPGFPQVMAVDSEEKEAENGVGGNAVDGQPATIWHTAWSTQAPPHPHHIILDLGLVRTVYGLRYLPRQDANLNGTIVEYEIYVSDDAETWGTAWVSGVWEPTLAEKVLLQSTGQRGRYVRLVAMSEANGAPWTSAAEIQIIAGLP
jgi:hypothetical protein